MKFIYKNEKEKMRFVENYEKALLLFNKITLFEDYFDKNSSRSSWCEQKIIDKRFKYIIELKSERKNIL